MRGITLRSILVVAVLAAASSAAAQQGAAGAGQAGEQPQGSAPTAEQARAHFERGTHLMQNENWEVALGEFEQSLALYPTRSALFNLGMCEKALHRYVAALRHFQEWQQRFGAAATEDERGTVSSTLDELQQFVGTLAIATTPPGATVRVDGTEVGTTPLAEPLLVDAGHHVVEAALDGYEAARRELEVAPLANMELTLPLEVRPPEIATPPIEETPVVGTPVDSSGVVQAWFWSTAGLAVAAGIGGAVAGGIALSKESDLDALGSRCQAGDLGACDEGSSMLGEHDDAQLAATVLFISAGAFAATALVLAFFTDFDFGETPPVEVTAGPAGMDASGSPTGVSLGLAVAF